MREALMRSSYGCLIDPIINKKMAKLNKPTINFTQVPNEAVRDKNLSWKAKWLYLYLWSKPDGWDFSAERIAPESSDGLRATKTWLQELEQFWYISRERQKTGKVDYQLHIKPKCQNELLGNEPKVDFSSELKQPSAEIDPISNTENTTNTVFTSNTVSISKDIGENPPEVGVQEISLDDIYAGSEDLKRGEIQKNTEFAETGIHPTPPTPSPRAKWPNPNVEAILSAIKQYHGWVDWSPAEERKYAHNLAKKIISHPTFSEFLFRSENEPEAIRLFVLAVCQRANSYQTWWTTSPKSLYYNLLKITNSKPKNSIWRA